MTDATPTPSTLLSSVSFGHNMRATNRLLQRELSSRVVRLGLNIGQWYALRTLWETDGITQIELANLSGIAGPAMVTAVRGLIAESLVSRQRHSNDRRKYIIRLTKKGWALRKPAIAISLEVNSLALQGITKEEINTCLCVLKRAHDNLLPLINRQSPAHDEVDELISPEE